ncbi:MAG TPA: hypothetical protein DCS43_03460 [Verrucomicrobia bacterium]|nr:hypothetical protein [Verrucomicrobiota bacterium]
MRSIKGLRWALMILSMGVAPVWAAKTQQAPVVVEPLTVDAAALDARYANQLEALRVQLKAALPLVDAQKQSAYLAAREVELAAAEDLDKAQQLLGRIGGAQAAVGHAKNKWIAGADKGIAKAQEMLKDAKTDDERAAAQKDLESWMKNREDGLQALKERQAKLDQVLAEEPALRNRQEAAQTVLTQAQAETLKAVDALGVGEFIDSSKLDGQLARFVVLSEATPRGLAVFAAQGEAQDALVAKLLEDEALMVQMLVADGANGGNYGQAMMIYTDIQQASAKAKDGVLQRLALAVALEHAVPVTQTNPSADTEAPATVDPVKRYLHYETAFLAGELDPGFKGLSVWDYRFVVDGDEPDAILAWGREMLRSYRPDHITTPDYQWRYVAAVRTEVQYGSQFNKYDKPELQSYQNMLMNGGVCGRRAFFGRFILRAFGIPTTARPQTGHAALVHWTPDGWVACLGAGWGGGTTKTRYTKDLDFLASTQARALGDKFMQVKRAQWIGDVMGEPRVFGFLTDTPGLWYGVALYRQRAMIEESKAVTLAAVGEELGEANESNVAYAFVSPTVTEADRRISVKANGVITIPASASSNPTESSGKILFMPSNLGGMQLHYSRTGDAQTFAYTFDAPEAGAYALTARVACPTWGQLLAVAPNGSQPIDIALPLTVGLWGQSEPVTISLVKGRNVLEFSRTGDNIRGLTIKEFTLTPVK